VVPAQHPNSGRRRNVSRPAVLVLTSHTRACSQGSPSRCTRGSPRPSFCLSWNGDPGWQPASWQCASWQCASWHGGERVVGVRKGCGVAVLNRPKALNSLTHNMVRGGAIRSTLLSLQQYPQKKKEKETQEVASFFSQHVPLHTHCRVYNIGSITVDDTVQLMIQYS